MKDPIGILEEAVDIAQQRGQVYGGVEDSFVRAAAIASLKLNRTISAYDVVTILESVKDARNAKNPTHRDSHIDAINYRAFRLFLAQTTGETNDE